MTSARPPSVAARALSGGALALVAATSLAACHGPRTHASRDRPLLVRDRLDCPDEEGRLRRVQVADDGRSCRYSGPDGQEVTLSYLTLAGRTPQTALAPLEADLRALVPSAVAPEPGSLAARADDDAAREDARDPDHADRAEARWSAGEKGGEQGVPATPLKPQPPEVDPGFRVTKAVAGERVKIDLPFLHIDADGNGRAHVRTFGADINAGEGGAVVKAGWGDTGATINAREGGAEMRFGAVGRRRADLTYIVASEHPGPEGWRAAAYVAKGPVAGPLVIASARGRGEMHGRHDDEVDDLKSLVNRNVRTAR